MNYGLFFFQLVRTTWPLSCSGCLSSALTELLSPLSLCYIFFVALGLHGTLLSSAVTGSPSPDTEGPVAGPLALNSNHMGTERNSGVQITSIISCHFSSDLQPIKWDQGQNPSVFLLISLRQPSSPLPKLE